MRTIGDKHMRKGRTLATCKVCGDKIMGSDFLDDIRMDKLSAIQRFQIRGIMRLAKEGAKVVGLELDGKDKKERVKSLLMVHFTRKKNRKHIDVLIDATKADDDVELLKKYLDLDSSLVKFIQGPNEPNPPNPP